jgi:hypothetical protein
MYADKTSLKIIPRDGVRRRLHLRTAGQQIDLELTGARFTKEQPIQWSTDQQKFRFMLETETTGNGEVQLLLAGLPMHSYKIICGKEKIEFQPDSKKSVRIRVPAGSARVEMEIVQS